MKVGRYLKKQLDTVYILGSFLHEIRSIEHKLDSIKHNFRSIVHKMQSIAHVPIQI